MIFLPPEGYEIRRVKYGTFSKQSLSSSPRRYPTGSGEGRDGAGLEASTRISQKREYEALRMSCVEWARSARQIDSQKGRWGGATCFGCFHWWRPDRIKGKRILIPLGGWAATIYTSSHSYRSGRQMPVPLKHPTFLTRRLNNSTFSLGICTPVV